MTHTEWVKLSEKEKKKAAKGMSKWLINNLQIQLVVKERIIKNHEEIKEIGDIHEIEKSEMILKKLYPLRQKLKDQIRSIEENKSPAWIQMNFYKIIGEFSL